MAWSNNPLVLYHGTTAPWARGIAKGIDLAKCSPYTEFGRGFYMTPDRPQAEVHAQRVYKQYHDLFKVGRSTFDPEAPALIKFEVDRVQLSELKTLAFVNPHLDWVTFVDHCLLGGAHMPATGENYEVVYGPVRGSTLLAAPRPDEQISFHTVAALKLLNSPQLFIGTP